MLIAAVTIILIVSVLYRTIEHALGRWINPDYAGVSKAGDYEYIVSSLGYAGYDSLITEKNWQEFMAYEYAVLMDVAEFLWEGQQTAEYEDNTVGPYPEEFYGGDNVEFYDDGKRGHDYKEEDVPDLRSLEGVDKAKSLGIQGSGPIYLPYLPVKQDYDSSKITKPDWDMLVIAGQGSARYGISNEGALKNSPGFSDGSTIYGGNRDVMPPTLTYEYKLNPNDPNGPGSLVPYISVLKEELYYYYFTVGDHDFWVAQGFNQHSGGVEINESNISQVDLMEISQMLNTGNYFIKNSTVWSKYWSENPDLDPTKNPDAWVIADETYEQNLYFMNSHSSVVYKTALQIMIDRYMPKASLLTSWYYLKDTEEASAETQGKENVSTLPGTVSSFDLEKLMKDVKGIYNYYCWTEPGEAIGSEVVESVKYDEDGIVIRDKATGEAIMGTTTNRVAYSNKDTFIHFGQAGIEANNFDVFRLYEPATHQGQNPKVSKEITGDEEERTVPVVTELLSEDAHFMDRFGYRVNFNYKYKYTYEVLSHYEDANGNTVPEGTEGAEARYTRVEAEANDSASIVIPYEATNDMSPRGESPYSMGELCKYIYENVVMKAEEEIPNRVPALKAASDYEIEYQEEEFANRGYKYPENTKTEDGKVKAQGLSLYDGSYHHDFPFYNFEAVLGDDAPSAEELKDTFKDTISDFLENLDQDPVATNLIKTYIEQLYMINDPGRIPVNEPNMSGQNPIFGSVTEVHNNASFGFIDVKRIAENEESDVTNYILRYGRLVQTALPSEDYNKTFTFENNFTKASEQPAPYNAIYDVDEYELALYMIVPQKRICTMIVTDVESWAKSANYEIEIVNNTFDYTNYRYVVPHSYFNFGVRVFKIDERPDYRTEYYKEYFSALNAEKAGIKEADILMMMMKWEEFAKSGNDTAYAYMRDLYKLIIYIREECDRILPTAYSYLYVPDTIWEFREGVSQMAFWTERLSAEMPGLADEMTQEDLNKVLVKKEEIAWQVLDYDEYEECQYVVDGETKARVYALFPYGNKYSRTYMMEEAVSSGKFDDGGFVTGHPAADWNSRNNSIGALAAGNNDFGITTYEIKTRALRKALSGNAGLSTKISNAQKIWDTPHWETPTNSIHMQAKKEVEAELKELVVKSPIVSIAAGAVVVSEYNCYSGFVVDVVHNNENAKSSAATSAHHMRRWPSVQVGDIVGPGTILGYEGTTGNSAAYHLHQELLINGGSASPAAYMAPIFAPFYNKEKILETIAEIESEWNAASYFVLGTEYMDLYRTVLKYPRLFGDENVKEYLTEGFNVEAGGVKHLLQCSLMEIDGKEYVNYQTGKKNGIPMYYSGDDTVIVKVGAAPSKYYLCKVQEEKATTELDDEGNEIPTNYLRVLSKKEIEFDETVLNGGVSIRVGVGADETTQIIWGNNVPLRPLFEDMADLVDITVLNTERTLDPKAEGYIKEYAGGGNGPGNAGIDVCSRAEYFTPSQDKLKAPDWILEYLVDVDSPYAVPFYEGPTSITMQNQIGTSAREIGYAGTASGDVIVFKKALKARGYKDADKISIEGEDGGKFDEQTVKVMQSAAATISDPTLAGYFSSGVLGRGSDSPNYSVDYDIDGVRHWNAYVTYGGIEEAKRVGREACQIAASMAGLKTSFVTAVATCESSLIPTTDSHKFCAGRGELNFYTSEKDAAFVTYRGVDKVLRRAVGLMQLAPPWCISWAQEKLGNISNPMTAGETEKVLKYLRTPKTNALIGAELLNENIHQVVTDPTLYGNLKSVVNSNSAFAQMETDSGIQAYEIALMGVSAAMYNMGDSAASAAIAALQTVTYNGTTVNGQEPGGESYMMKVMNAVVAEAREYLKQK